jgi:hypothetical protein
MVPDKRGTGTEKLGTSGSGTGAGALWPPQAVLDDLPAERVSVDPERLGRTSQAAVRTAQYLRHEASLEASQGILEPNAPVDHLADESFHLFAHG